jgi:hypothetical protein
MKTHADKFDPQTSSLLSSNKAQMIRTGKSGTSSELLSIEQQRHIDDYCRAELQRLGSDFPYDEMFTVA